MAENPGTPVDLSALRRACHPVIACYERLLSEQRLDIHQLNDALASLRRAPRLGGRLGRAMALLVGGGAGASVEQTVAALELLRATSGLRLTAPAAAVVAGSPHKPAASRPGQSTQLGLSGLDDDDDHRGQGD